jgi:hypothetical protein
MAKLETAFEWLDSPSRWAGDAAVSLHSHSMHSREGLHFIYRIASRFGFIGTALAQGERRFRASWGCEMDLSRGYWTPPLSAHEAWNLEKRGIEESINRRAFVSLTDHDSIEGPLALRVLEECADLPISLEWTVPFGPTFLHLGIHNLPVDEAPAMAAAMTAFKRSGAAKRLSDLLAWVAADPQTLVVLNHPLWDEGEAGSDVHRRSVEEFLAAHRQWVHALELNGLRSWAENRQVRRMAESIGLPAVAGGDRHGLTPNTLLNLTAASRFGGFAEEIRKDKQSRILVRTSYRSSRAYRVVQDLCDILSYQEGHSLGWKAWSQRVFYTFQDGVPRPLIELWRREPRFVRHFIGTVNLLRSQGARGLLKLALTPREDPALL